jgi:NADH-quinone oxidoreductase subunit H
MLFLGGWHTGFLPELSSTFGRWLGSAEQPSCLGWVIGNVINVVVFVLKGWLLVFVQMWVRWTLPRLRIDQVMMTCLKYLLPISCVAAPGRQPLAGGRRIQWSGRISAMCCAPCAWPCSAGWC